MKKSSIALMLSLSLFQTLGAADFTIKDGETVNIQQVLSDKGDKGKIEEGGTLSTAGTAVDMQNDDQKLKNHGEISTSGSSGYGILSNGVDAKIKNSGEISTSGDSASGIFSIASNARVKNSGGISTSGFGANGIFSNASNARIKNRGEISTSGDLAFGIFGASTDAKIKNSGEISTSGDLAFGILSNGVDAKIKNSGEISTSGDNGFGISSQGADAKIKNSGAISTSDSNASGIHSESFAAKIKNSGEITTSGSGARGIFSTVADAKIKNSGEITTSGSLAHGIHSTDVDVNIKNSGDISTDGLEAIGILSEGADARIKNSGEIATSEETAHGIRSTGADARIKNSGEISTIESRAVGINSRGADAKIKNSGEISTRGDVAYGIFSFGADAKIKNSGEILISGSETSGIFSFGADARIKNSGEISTSGIDASGILSTNSNLQLTNSGTIKSEQSFAINMFGDNPTLTLKRGSNIQGGVSTASALNLYVKKGLNLDLTIEGAGGFDDIGIDDPYVIDGLRVVVADRSGFALQADFLADLSDVVLGGKPVTDCCYDPCGGGFWLAGIGSYRDRSSKDRIVGYRNEQAGLLFGCDTSVCSGNAGIFGAVMYGNQEISRHTQHADTTSYIAGLNYSKAYCGTCYGLSVAGGYVDWENRRHVMNNLVDGGRETGKADLDGTFISAELLLSEQVCCLPCSPTMSVTLRYAGLYFGDYHEKGIEAPLSVEDRNIDLLTTRVEFAFTENPYNALCLCIEPYFGFYGRYQFQGKRVDAELLGEELSFTQGNHHSLAAVLFGIRGTKEWNANTLFMNLETDYDNQRSSRVIGELGIRF